MRGVQWLLEAAVLSLAAVWLTVSKPTAPTPAERGLLPPSLVPELYEISLEPSLERGVFHGLVVITGVTAAPTDRVVLHCKGLVLNTTEVMDLSTGEKLGVELGEEDRLLQQCTLRLDRPLEPDHEYSISLEFMGVISRDGVGLYRDYYIEEGVRREVLMTHFQPNLARSVFPCFDEPHYKAQFLLRVARQGFPTVLSNMPASRDSRPDVGWVQFEETPPMSPYLLVLVMCDYLALSDSATNTSVWAPRSRLHEAQLALNISVAVLEYCERYFGTEYSLPKLDHVAVPTLNTVAMENWGAITYKNTFLLWEEGVSTWAQKELISNVICHEIIHQWLGNLVTTSWWNTTWLNEGVTSFYHYYIMDKIEPSWDVMDNMFISQIQAILDTDAEEDLRPLTSDMPLNQDSIHTAFSATTYLKGAAIVRMVFNLMSPDVFREAISQYIIDNEYGSVDEEDLWQSLAAAADLPVDLEEVMEGWTHQRGYPLITVERGDDGCLSVSQSHLGDRKSENTWTIPLTFTTSLDLDFNVSNTLWFPKEESKLDLDVCLEKSDWILVNIRQSGFYQVNYDPLTWRALTHDLLNCDLSDIHPVNRAQLLHDGFFLARHRVLEYPVILELSRYLPRETEYLPWSVAIVWLTKLRAELYRTDVYHRYQRFALSLVEEPYNRMGLFGEAGGMLQELHRKQLMEFACGLSHPRCVKEATDTVYLLMSGVDFQIPLELKSVLLCAAVRHGQGEVWHFVLKGYLEGAANDRWRYLSALACTRDHQLIDRLLKAVATPGSFVKSEEEKLQLLIDIGREPGAFDAVITMVLENFRILSADFDFEMILHILGNILPPVLTDREADKFNSLAALIGKNSPTMKQVELLYSISDVINAPRPQNTILYIHSSIKQWLYDVYGDDDGGNEDNGDEEDNDFSLHFTMTPPSSTTDDQGNISEGKFDDDEETAFEETTLEETKDISKDEASSDRKSVSVKIESNCSFIYCIIFLLLFKILKVYL